MRIHAALLLLAMGTSPMALARVVRVEISSRTDVLGGKSFGAAGPYERIEGKVYFAVAVSNPHNARIVDLRRAANLRNGEVEFSADFYAVRPKDVTKGNGALLLEVPNRGSSRIISLVDGGDWNLAANAGDGWLLRNGYSVAAIGWQWDAAGADALRFYAPIAVGANGRAITGMLRGDLMPSRRMAEIPLGHLITGRMGGTEYPVGDPSDARNVLTVRDTPAGERRAIPRANWTFAQMVDGKLVPSNRHIHLDGGFEAGKIYEYCYTVANPVIAGLGFAATRDFAAYAKHQAGAVAPAKRVYGEGISQDGRFLRDFLYEGFNADEEGEMALDGVLAHVAGAGRGSFNYRFAQPSRDAEPTSSLFFPTDIFPFTDLPETDPQNGATAGLLDEARKDHVPPKIFFSNTSYEYWGRTAALIHTSADGKRDVELSPEVRVYHFTGLQHFSGPFPPSKGTGDLLGQEPESPLPVHYFWRAMIANMDAWVRGERPPPPSSYPRLADHTLVLLDQYRFPDIPGVAHPRDANRAYRLDFGPDWRDGILSMEPPHVGAPFPVLVPQVDEDGNEMDGVRLPELTTPLATYTGWNLRDPSIGAPEQRTSFEGSFIAFARTAADREKAHDPRRSIAERYASREGYLAKYRQAVDALVEQRWILTEDRERLVQRGGAEWDAIAGR